MVVAVVTFGTLVAHAQPSAAEKTRAGQLMGQGEAFEAAESLESALTAYRHADEIMGVPSTRVAVARVLATLGRLIHAREVAAQVTRMPVTPQEPTAFVRARSEAARLVGDLDRRIPTLTVVVTATAPVVTIDGVGVSSEEATMLDPGPHSVSASAPGCHPVRQNVELAEGERRRISLELRPVPVPTPKPPPPRHVPAPDRETPTLAYVALGVGGLGIGAGAITGLMSISRAGQLKDECGGSVCPIARKQELEDAKTLGWVSNVGFGVGLIGVGVGVLALSASREQREGGARGTREVTLIGPGQIGIRGRF
jgi:hypothetical protein